MKNAARFLQIFSNVCRMLEARDYFPSHDWTSSNLKEFVEKVGTDLEDIESYVLTATKVGNSKEKMCVFFPQDRVNKAVLVTLREKAQKLECTSFILCAKSDMTGATRQLIRSDPDFTIQYFMDWKFLVNLPDHDMVPHHVVLSGASTPCFDHFVCDMLWTRLLKCGRFSCESTVFTLKHRSPL